MVFYMKPGLHYHLTGCISLFKQKETTLNRWLPCLCSFDFLKGLVGRKIEWKRCCRRLICDNETPPFFFWFSCIFLFICACYERYGSDILDSVSHHLFPPICCIIRFFLRVLFSGHGMWVRFVGSCFLKTYHLLE